MTRTAYPADAIAEIVDALNETGEVDATVMDDYTVRVGRQLSGRYQAMGQIGLEIDEDEDGNETLVQGETLVRRSSWAERIVRDVLDRHNR